MEITKDRVKEILRKNGLKVTPQRLEVLKVVARACYYGEHVNTDAIYKEVRKVYENLSLATVYKNLNVLFEEGIVEQYVENTKEGYGVIYYRLVMR